MTLAEIVRYIHALNADLQMYERKYNILSQTFYEWYQAGEEPPDDAWVLDWSDWAGAYELWLERQAQYREMIQKLHEQLPLNMVIEKATRHEPIAIVPPV